MTKVFHCFFKNLNSGCFSTRLAARDMETKSGTTSSSKASQTIFLCIYFLFPWKWKDTGKNDKNDIPFFPISNGLAIQTFGGEGSHWKNKKEWLRIWCHTSAENWLQKTATEQFPQSLKKGFSNCGLYPFKNMWQVTPTSTLLVLAWAKCTGLVWQLLWHKRGCYHGTSPGSKFW